MCRNHRGFVEATLACSKLGANALYLNTAFAAPQLADVIEREEPVGADLRRGVRASCSPSAEAEDDGRSASSPGRDEDSPRADDPTRSRS